MCFVRVCQAFGVVSESCLALGLPACHLYSKDVLIQGRCQGPVPYKNPKP